VPGPGKSVPSTVEMSAPLHMPCPITSRKRLLIARVDVRGIDVTRHYGEERDVLLGKCAFEHGRVADVDFLEGTVLDEFHLDTLVDCEFRRIRSPKGANRDPDDVGASWVLKADSGHFEA
jgi:hypothetical protein